MKKIIYPYIRFSSKQQAGGSSLQRQWKDILKYAEDNEYTVNNNLKLEDLGLSAYKADHIKKGSLGGFLEALKAGVIENDGSAYLCIEQIDRLSRQSIDDAYQIFRTILKANVNIITLMDGKIYTKKSLNDLMTVMYSSMLMDQANQESSIKSERILKSFDEKIEKLTDGKKIQFVGMFPGWIDNQGTRKETNFVINNKAKIVQRAFKMYISGTSMGDIARIFNDEKIGQVAKKRHKNFTNTWSSAKVCYMLNSRCVIGDLIIKKTGDIFENYYPSIISIDDFDVVQDMRTTKKTKKYAGRKSINIYTGKMFCSGCGQKYYFETDDKMTKKGRTLYYMLKCQGRRVLGCKSKSIKYDDFIASTPNMFGMISKKEDNSKPIKVLKDKISEISLETKKIKSKMNELEKLNDNDELDFTIYLKESSKLQKLVKINDTRIAGFKVNIARLSSDNKLDNFDKTDPISVTKAKRFINENFAAFIISSDSKACTAIYSDGQTMSFILSNSKVEKKDNSRIVKYFDELFELKEEILQAYNSDRMDGKFIEILKATNYWGIQTPEKQYSLD